MANSLDPMDIKQIITLHLDNESNRQIGEILGISRNTVNSYIKSFKACEYSFRELLEMDCKKLEELFTTQTTIDNERYSELTSFFDSMKEHRNHPGFTLLHHYAEYKLQSSNPYSYSQFAEHYKRKHKNTKGSMKLDHEPGKELYIDFAGSKLQTVDSETGEITDAEVLVATLPNSQYTYVEAVRSQKREDMIPAVENALIFFGGVPKAIVSDNLKSAVTRASKYEPVINKTFKDFARHCGCVINPTRSYAPQDKALVEQAVSLVYQRIYYPMRAMTFFSLKELNSEILKHLGTYNGLIFQRKQASRKELFQSVERGYLKPLPESRYEMKDYRRAKVQKMGYVYFSPDKSYYSVPYRYIGKMTHIHYTASAVEVYFRHGRIAFHKRNHSQGAYNTQKDHLSSTHKAVSEWSPGYFKGRAAKHGRNVERAIEANFDMAHYPEIAYKRSMGIIQLHREFGSERLNKACEMALAAGSCSYMHISNILKNKQDILFAGNQEQEAGSHIPEHGNTRGPASYN